jgi:hypothetical protein
MSKEIKLSELFIEQTKDMTDAFRSNGGKVCLNWALDTLTPKVAIAYKKWIFNELDSSPDAVTWLKNPDYDNMNDEQLLQEFLKQYKPEV